MVPTMNLSAFRGALPILVNFLFILHVAGQSNTITSLTASRLFPPSGSDCYGDYERGICLTASYILASCQDNNRGVDNIWGCFCTNGYDTAWKSCNSCLHKYNTTNDDNYSTTPYIASCSSILSALSRAAASTSSKIASGTSQASTGATPALSQGAATTRPTTTASATGSSNNGCMTTARIWLHYLLPLVSVVLTVYA